jgi:transcriptional regulator GlxA family with amidase domain
VPLPVALSRIQIKANWRSFRGRFFPFLIESGSGSNDNLMAKIAMPGSRHSTVNVGIFGYDRCSAWIVAGILELFELANVLGGRLDHDARRRVFQVRVVSAGGPAVTASHKIQFRTFRYRGALDVLIVPPIWHTSTENLVAALRVMQPSLAKLRALAERSRLITSACSGSVLLAEARLLEGRTATTCWWLRDWFRRRYAAVNLRPERLIAVDGATWTAAAGSAYIHLCLKIVGSFGSEQLAATVAQFMLVDPNRESQAPFLLPEFQESKSDELVESVRKFVFSHLDRSFNLAEVASVANVSLRTLFRRFQKLTNMTPLDFVREARIERAKRLLSQTGDSVDAIAPQCGYEDVSSFRKLFRKQVGLTPGDYRQRFSRLQAP